MDVVITNGFNISLLCFPIVHLKTGRISVLEQLKTTGTRLDPESASEKVLLAKFNLCKCSYGY